jgi:hypothetical protein
MKNFRNKHSLVSKFFHILAFNSTFPLISLANIESRLLQNDLEGIKNQKPVFITSLPRSGTTLMLELCVGTREFISHTYRDMPFLLTPIFWDRFSKHFRRSDILQERVQGDRVMVNANSPEAFEEIIWKKYWPSRYKSDRIIPWPETNYQDFEDFFFDHIRKIIHLRGGINATQSRYISKNNLNIARIKYLKSVFPDAIILIPFRSPLQHAASLLRQHLNFLYIHEKDPFAKRYMEDTGHFDFGHNLRPIDFENWLSKKLNVDPQNITFWLQYWVSTYKYLLSNVKAQVHFFPYNLLCSDPENSLKQLAHLLDIKNTELLLRDADRIVKPKQHQIDTKNIDSNILDQAKNLYLDLIKNCS